MVITGKGGAGKITLTALSSKLFAGKEYNVLAADEDPQANFPYSLGIPPDQEITPASRNLESRRKQAHDPVKVGVPCSPLTRMSPTWWRGPASGRRMESTRWSWGA